MFKEGIFAVDFSDWNDRIAFELTDLTPEGYSGMFDNWVVECRLKMDSIKTI